MKFSNVFVSLGHLAALALLTLVYWATFIAEGTETGAQAFWTLIHHDIATVMFAWTLIALILMAAGETIDRVPALTWLRGSHASVMTIVAVIWGVMHLGDRSGLGEIQLLLCAYVAVSLGAEFFRQLLHRTESTFMSMTH